jgi:hypothetical protein
MHSNAADTDRQLPSLDYPTQAARPFGARQVTLIDQGERFVFKPLLYDLLAGVAQPWEVAPYFSQLLGPYSVNFIQVGLFPATCSPRPNGLHDCA